MRHNTITTAVAFLFNIQVSVSVPLAGSGSAPSEVGQPCGQSLGDCAGALTCIPLSTDCTEWTNSWGEGCPGTCQNIDISQQQIYTLCGGWGLMDDCDERIERCIGDPRWTGNCGPSCDGPGICWPYKEACGGASGMTCPQGKECFEATATRSGYCFPLRFGSDYYKKSELEEITRTDQDGHQGDEKP